ncbi:MAG: ABC transporter ATP-binding protein [Candidatus Aenigmatarchaeota archaeon]
MVFMLAVRVKNLWFSYGEEWVIKGVNLKIKQGELVSIIGPNGCGKTTLVKHFNGLLKPTKGKVFVKGIDTTQATTAELARIVGYVFQNPNNQIFLNTIFDEVAFGPRNLGLQDVEELVFWSLKKLGLFKDTNKPPFLLSMGEKERLAIASLLAMKPEILILDEPTTGQDSNTCLKIVELMKELKEEGKTIILISHDMEIVAEHSDKVIAMKKGKIVKEGKPEKIFSNFKLLEELSLYPPQLFRVGKMLGLRKIPRSIEEFARELRI